jgi:hypothetical protein
MTGKTCYGDGDDTGITEDMVEFQGACGQCFGETHIYALYLDLVHTAADPPACIQHPAAELCATLGVAARAAGTVAQVQARVQAAAVAADEAAGPGGLIVAGILLGLLVGCCCRCFPRRKLSAEEARKKVAAGYKPVAFNQE